MFITRAILYAIVAVLIISLVRSVIGILAKSFFDVVNPSRPAQPGRPTVQAGGELKKDPVCGTFISMDTALQKKVGKDVYYFCSPECRDKFRA